VKAVGSAYGGGVQAVIVLSPILFPVENDT
jgi:hypothetical protein